MQLTREKGQRMWGGGGSSIAGGGGGGGTSLAGYATESWVDDNYLSKEFWNQLFVIHTSTTTTVKDSGGTIISGPTTVNTTTLDPNTLAGTTETTDEATGNVTTVTVAITSIEAKKGLWTDFFLSALGKNASGTGGVLSLNDLVDVEISNPQSGEVLKYNGSKWVNGTGGGGGSTAWADITGKPTTIAGYGITDAKIVNGTIYLGSSSITPITTETDPTVPAWAKASTKPSYSFSELTNHPTTLSGYGITDAYTKSEVYTKTEADERFLTIAFFSRLFQAKNGSTNVNPNDTTSTIDNIKALFGFWTDQYISALGQNSSGGGGGGGSSTLAGLNDVQLGTLAANDVLTYDGNGRWVNTSKSTFLSGYATQAWVGQQNYLTTETDPTVPAWAKASTKPSYSFGELTSHPTTLSGYGITDAVNISTTWWGQSIVNGTVTGNLSSVRNITMSESIVGLKSLEFNTSGELQGFGGFLDFHYNGSLADFTSRIIEETSGVLSIQAGSLVNNEFVGAAAALVVGIGYNGSSITIGNGKLVWDETNNSLKVIRSNGSAANIYATGGVSALGMQAGVSALDAMTFNYVTINNNLEFGAASRITHAVINDDRTLYIGNSDNSGWVGLADMCSQAGSDKWYIYAATGEASFMTSVRSARFYLDSSRYLYLDGSNNLMFYNGSTPKQVAFVN